MRGTSNLHLPLRPPFAFKGNVVPWDEVLKEYYLIRGWSNRGLPTMEKLKGLKIEDLGEGLDL
jgi:aldehyde:ferredoxin oxidoreductase